MKPSEKKLVVLPEKGRDPTLRPYDVDGERYYPLPDSEGFVQYGKASWYGKKFHGHRTSSGEIYNMYKVSGAHKTLPMGTHVNVTNRENKREIVVRINDRGPFVKGRIIDLSYAAARRLGMLKKGVVDVKIEALGKEVGQLKSPLGVKPIVETSNLSTGDFSVQVGAFEDKYNALRLVDRLKIVFDYVDVAVHRGRRKTLFRVRVSRSKTLSKAGEIKKKLEEMGFKGAFIVSL